MSNATGERRDDRVADLSFQVHGLPTAQGSKRAFVSRATGRAHVVETNHDKVQTWREDVKQAALAAVAGHPGFVGSVHVRVVFTFPRPKGHYRTGRSAHMLRDSAPAYPAVKPDIDKVVRSTLDAITTAGVWTDDRLVVELEASKRYADDGLVGAYVEIEAA